MMYRTWLACGAAATALLLMHLAAHPAEWPFIAASLVAVWAVLVSVRRSAGIGDPDRARALALDADEERSGIEGRANTEGSPLPGWGARVPIVLAGLLVALIVGSAVVAMRTQPPVGSGPGQEMRP